MSTATADKLVSAEEFLALPLNDEVDRELIRGVIREKPMTYRNMLHAHVVSVVVFFLTQWVRSQPKPRGRILSGDAGFLLAKKPDTIVGVDIAYVSAKLAAKTPRRARVIQGVPTLAAEILSPSDTVRSISKKLDEYLRAKVPVIWVIDPFQETVTVYGPDAPAKMFSADQVLDAEPHLPGFRVTVSEFFE